MFREQGQIGNSWTKIALLIPGRRYHSTSFPSTPAFDGTFTFLPSSYLNLDVVKMRLRIDSTQQSARENCSIRIVDQNFPHPR